MSKAFLFPSPPLTIADANIADTTKMLLDYVRERTAQAKYPVII